MTNSPSDARLTRNHDGDLLLVDGERTTLVARCFTPLWWAVCDLQAQLMTLAVAAIRYDAEIQRCANAPEAMSSHCTAQGDTLDALYADWIGKARAAVAGAPARPRNAKMDAFCEHIASNAPALGVRVDDTLGQCPACGEGTLHAVAYVIERDGKRVPQVKKQCDHCRADLFGGVEGAMNRAATIAAGASVFDKSSDTPLRNDSSSMAVVGTRGPTDWLVLAQQCGGTVYRNRADPQKPGVAFGDESWARFTEALSKHAGGAIPTVAPAPVAWMHVQGNHSEPSLRELDDDEKARGWTQYPLYAAHGVKEPKNG